MRDDVKAFLNDLQAHPLWPLLLKEIEKPEIPTFRKKDAESVESARAAWVYQSGRLHQWESMMAVLLKEKP